MPQLIADENGISNFVDNNGASAFVDQDGDFFSAGVASTYTLSLASRAFSLGGVAATLSTTHHSTYTLSLAPGALSLAGVATSLTSTAGGGFKVHFRYRKAP